MIGAYVTPVLHSALVTLAVFGVLVLFALVNHIPSLFVWLFLARHTYKAHE